MCAKNRHQCECGSFSMVPVRGFGLALDTSGIACELPAAPEALYVNATSGDDSNDGLSPVGAFKTINAAVRQFESYYFVKRGFTIHIASGTYSEDIDLNFRQAPNAICFRGDDSDYPVLEGEITIRYQAVASFHNCHFKGRYEGVLATHGGIVSLTNCRATAQGPSQLSCFSSNYGGMLEISQNMDVDCTAGSRRVFRSIDQSRISLNPSARIIIRGDVSEWVCHTARNSEIRAELGSEVTGNVTGIKYGVFYNAIISVPDANPGFFPGSQPGTLLDGLYVGL